MNQKNSIDYQVEHCRRYATNNGLRIASLSIDGVCDDGVICERHTAFKTAALEIRADGTIKYRIERPKFQRLVAALATQTIRGVICLCWDRLSQNPHDDAVIKDLLTRGVDIRFVQASYDNSSAGALHMDIDGMFAAHYSRVSSEKIRGANAKLRSEGKCTTGAPLGYLDQGPDRKPFDPERAPIIKRLFELYATGEWSIAGLTRWARRQGLTVRPRRSRRTPEEIAAGEENWRTPTSRPATEKTVENLLHNPFYCGRLRHGEEEFPGRHEPLVSVELFSVVQQQLAERTVVVHYIDKPFFTYRGLVHCRCSRRYSPYAQKGHAYYRARCRAECTNQQVNVPESYLDDLVADLIGRICLTDQELAEIEVRAPQQLAESAKRRIRRENDFDRQQVRLERDLKYLVDNKITLLREGVYGPAEYAEGVRRLERELYELHARREQFKTLDEAEMFDTVLTFLERLKAAQQSYKYATPSEKRELMMLVFLELTVANGTLANVGVKEGFRELFKRGGVPSGAPDYVFLELPSLYQAAKTSMEKLSSGCGFLRVTPG